MNIPEMPKEDLDRLTTRDGRKVRIYAVDGRGTYCVHGAVEADTGGWQIKTWGPGGHYGFGTGENLILPPRRIKREVWVNVYPATGAAEPGRTSGAYGWSTRKIADDAAGHNRIACIPITIDCEEGEGL